MKITRPIMREILSKIKTAGFGDSDELWYDVQANQICGEIKDGVSFAHIADKCPGWWVVAFEDLEKIYLEAKKVRIEK